MLNLDTFFFWTTTWNFHAFRITSGVVLMSFRSRTTCYVSLASVKQRFACLRELGKVFCYFVSRIAVSTSLSVGKVLRWGISTQAFLDIRNLQASTEILRKFGDGCCMILSFFRFMKISQMVLFRGYELVIGEVTFRGEPTVFIVRVEGALHIFWRAKHSISKLAPHSRAIDSQVIFTKCAVYR